jgi:hypothetical protein
VVPKGTKVEVKQKDGQNVVQIKTEKPTDLKSDPIKELPTPSVPAAAAGLLPEINRSRAPTPIYDFNDPAVPLEMV